MIDSSVNDIIQQDRIRNAINSPYVKAMLHIISLENYTLGNLDYNNIQFDYATSTSIMMLAYTILIHEDPFVYWSIRIICAENLVPEIILQSRSRRILPIDQSDIKYCRDTNPISNLDTLMRCYYSWHYHHLYTIPYTITGLINYIQGIGNKHNVDIDTIYSMLEPYTDYKYILDSNRDIWESINRTLDANNKVRQRILCIILKINAARVYKDIITNLTPYRSIPIQYRDIHINT